MKTSRSHSVLNKNKQETIGVEKNKQQTIGVEKKQARGCGLTIKFSNKSLSTPVSLKMYDAVSLYAVKYRCPSLSSTMPSPIKSKSRLRTSVDGTLMQSTVVAVKSSDLQR